MRASHGRITAEVRLGGLLVVTYDDPRSGFGYHVSFHVNDLNIDTVQKAAVAGLIDNITGGAEHSANRVIHELLTKWRNEND